MGLDHIMLFFILFLELAVLIAQNTIEDKSLLQVGHFSMPKYHSNKEHKKKKRYGQ
jgi:hypothetical protein